MTIQEPDAHPVVAIYDSHDGAEAAARALDRSGFDMKRLSIVGTDIHTEDRPVGFYTEGDCMKFWGKRGAFWGSLSWIGARRYGRLARGIVTAPRYRW